MRHYEVSRVLRTDNTTTVEKPLLKLATIIFFVTIKYDKFTEIMGQS